MRGIWIVLLAAVIAAALCVGLFWGGSIGLDRWLGLRPVTLRMPRFPQMSTEMWSDNALTTINLMLEDNEIAVATIFAMPASDWITSGGHLTGVGTGGGEDDPAEAPDNAEPPTRTATHEEIEEQALLEVLKGRSSLDQSTCLTFVREGRRTRIDDVLPVTREELRRFARLLEERGFILDAARECWKDNPDVMKRLDKLPR